MIWIFFMSATSYIYYCSFPDFGFWMFKLWRAGWHEMFLLFCFCFFKYNPDCQLLYIPVLFSKLCKPYSDSKRKYCSVKQNLGAVSSFPALIDSFLTKSSTRLDAFEPSWWYLSHTWTASCHPFTCLAAVQTAGCPPGGLWWTCLTYNYLTRENDGWFNSLEEGFWRAQKDWRAFEAEEWFTLFRWYVEDLHKSSYKKGF